MKNILYLIFAITLFSNCSSSDTPLINEEEGKEVLPPEDLTEKKLVISGGSASSAEIENDKTGFENSYDETLETIWHTKWSEQDQFPYTITYNLEKADKLTYIKYYPRTNGYNGYFGKIEIQVSTEAKPTFVKVMDFDCEEKSSMSKIILPTAIQKPTAVRFIIKSGKGGFASCAEMEFFSSNPNLSVVEVPLGGNSYVIDSDQKVKVTDNGFVDWSTPKALLGTYFKVNKKGSIALYLRYRADAANVIQITCQGKTFDATLVKSNTETITYIGTIDEPKQGYIEAQFRGKDLKGTTYANASTLLVKGDATTDMNFVGDFSFYWGRRGPSVHMSYALPTDKTIEWFYNEVTIPQGMDPLGTYAMTNGFKEGYCGIQVNSTTERRFLFSVWSPFETEDPSQIPEDQRIVLVKKGKDVVVGEFGNEGSGGQSYLRYNWKAGLTYKFLTRIRPIGNNRTEYTAYYLLPNTETWGLIAQFLRPSTQTYYSNAHSFLENFNNNTGHLTRKAYYSNQWVCTTTGEWIELQQGRFTIDGTGAAKARLDYKGGIEDNKFFLQNCGFFNDNTEAYSQFNRKQLNNNPNIKLEELP